MMYERHRFRTNDEDYRPVLFPPPGPYWCTGYSVEPGYATIVAYMPKGSDLMKYWPDATNVETEEVEAITYTDRFPRPSWYALLYCNICHRELDQPDKPDTLNCGGDCLRCMAECGDTDCIARMRKLKLPFNP